MAYETDKLNVMASTPGGGPTLWSYTGSDTVAVVKGVAYITDAADKGMKVNDLVLIGGSDAGVGFVDTINANGSAELT